MTITQVEGKMPSDAELATFVHSQWPHHDEDEHADLTSFARALLEEYALTELSGVDAKRNIADFHKKLASFAQSCAFGDNLEGRKSAAESLVSMYRAALSTPAGDQEDAERWRQLLKGQALWYSGVTEKGKPWSVYHATRDNHNWQESFIKAIDEQRKNNDSI